VDQVVRAIAIEEPNVHQRIGLGDGSAEQADALTRHVAIGQAAVGPADRNSPQPDAGHPETPERVEFRVVVQRIVDLAPGHQ